MKKFLFSASLSSLLLLGFASLSQAQSSDDGFDPNANGGVRSIAAQTAITGTANGATVSGNNPLPKAPGAEKAIQFDGLNDYLTAADSPLWDFGTGDFTIDGWICTPTPSAVMRIISAGSHTDGGYNLWTFGYGSTPIWGTGNRLNFARWNGSGYDDYSSEEIAISPNTFHHVAVVRSGSSLTFYFDGAIKGSPIIAGAVDGGSTGLIFGARHYTSPSDIIEWNNGIIDEVRLWNVGRTQEQIREDMHRFISAQAGLVGYWRFDEGAGATAADSSGNENNGTLVNEPAWVVSPAPLGSDGVFVYTTTPASVGPSGASIQATIISTPDDANNLGVYVYGSPTGAPVTADVFPDGVTQRSDIVWGIAERGSVAADAVFDYSSVTEIAVPSQARILRRANALVGNWIVVNETARDTIARTITVNEVETFGEYAIGVQTTEPSPGAVNALSFQNDTYVRVEDSPSLDITDRITMETWIYKTWNGEDWNIILSKPWNSDSDPWHVYRLGLTNAGDVPKNALFSLALSGGMAAVGGASVILNNIWTHIAATYDGTQIKIYVNGILEGTQPATGAISTNNQPLVIGKNLLNTWNDFFGHIDEVRLWNIARTETEIRDNMHQRLAGGNTGLVGYWRLDEGSGISTLDHSANGNNGTLVNGPAWLTSTAPFGSVGAYVNTTAQTSVGPSGGQLKVTISSTPDDANNLGIYQFGSLSAPFVTGETFPAGFDQRSDIVWGIVERGDVTATLVFDYSGQSGIIDPSQIDILKRDDAGDTSWDVTNESSRDDDAMTITIENVADFGEYALGVGVSGVESGPGEISAPAFFALLPTCPNPARKAAVIKYQLPGASSVRLGIYNVAGQLVRTLVDGNQPAGVHSARWDGRDDRGREISTGVYLYRLSAGGNTAIQKLVYVK